jgi:hypothetical protein
MIVKPAHGVFDFVCGMIAIPILVLAFALVYLIRFARCVIDEAFD